MERSFKLATTKPPYDSKLLIVTKDNYAYVGVFRNDHEYGDIVVKEDGYKSFEDTDKWMIVERYNNIIIYG